MILLFCHPALDAGSLQLIRQGYRLGGRYDRKKGRYDMILLFCHPALDAGSLQLNRQGYRLGGRYDRKKRPV